MSNPLSPIPHPQQNQPIGSRSEKAIARAAFDAALGRELHGGAACSNRSFCSQSLCL
jgi:hypothetical protein